VQRDSVQSIITELQAECTSFGEKIRIKTNLLGKDLTTFAIGGPLACVLDIGDAAALCHLVEVLRAQQLRYRILGAGSNVLIDSEGLSSVVVRLGKEFQTAEFRAHGRVRVGGAFSLMRLSRLTATAALSGLEFAGGIPASMGGAIFMNAGAHGGECGEIVEEVTVVIPGEGIVVLSGSELCFSYRHAKIPEGAVVIGATLALVSSERELVEAQRSALLKERKLRQPLSAPCAGSIFKNPSGYAAGQLIEAVGLKGEKHGGAEVSALHANWIVNSSRTATSHDVLSLVNYCKAKVGTERGVQLEPELFSWSDKKSPSH